MYTVMHFTTMLFLILPFKKSTAFLSISFKFIEKEEISGPRLIWQRRWSSLKVGVVFLGIVLFDNALYIKISEGRLFLSVLC